MEQIEGIFIRVYSTDRPAVIYRPVCKIHAGHVSEILLVPIDFSYSGTLPGVSFKLLAHVVTEIQVSLIFSFVLQ